jgi:plasmid stabilization system protein ParE
MAWTLRLARSAEQDVIDILAWTNEYFGKEQSMIYAETLTLGLEALTAGPGIIGVKKTFRVGPRQPPTIMINSTRIIPF